MNRKVVWITCLFLMVSINACERNMDMPVREPVRFREVLNEGTFSFGDLERSLLSLYSTGIVKDYDKLLRLVSLLDTTRTVLSTSVSYMTTDPLGKEILASGLVMRPAGKRSKGILFFFPSAKIDKTTTATQMMLTFEGLLSFFGYTVIIPDMIGYGISSYAEYPFLFADNTGQVAYDLHLAVAEYFHLTGIPFPRKVTIGGYSMGGMGVVALHRHIEEYDTEGIIVEASYPGGGVYDLGMATDILTLRRRCAFPFIPYLYVSMDYWYGLDLDYREVFIDPLLSNMDDWLSRKYLSHEMRQFIPADMTAYMHPDVFTTHKNRSLIRADSCLRLHSVIGKWAPKAPMTIVHTVNDDMAPYEIAERMYKTFLANGGNVTLVKGDEDHFNDGIEYYVAMLLYLLIKK